MFADKITKSMQITIDLMESRRKKQQAYNEKHGIVPKTVFRKIAPSFAPIELDEMIENSKEEFLLKEEINLEEKISELEEGMRVAAESLEFERAAELRDRISELKKDTDEISRSV